MAEVTYYFNSRSTGNWTDPDNMIDGLIVNSAYTSSTGTTEILDENTCPGDDLGTITAVEGRVYGHGDADDELIVQIRLDEAHKGGTIYVPGTSPGWSDYFAVNVSTWADVMALTAHIIFNKVAKANTMHCAKVEIRVTYTPEAPPPEKVTQYFAGNDCPEFPHEMDVSSGKLPCPPPYD